MSFTQSLVTDSKTIFPAVTICNLHPFDITNNFKYLIGVIKKAGIDTFDLTITTDNQARSSVNNIVDFLRANVVSDSVTTYDSNSSDFLEHLGYSIQSMVISCEFNSVKCDLTTDFQRVYSPIYGNCYTFNKQMLVNGFFILKTKFLIRFISKSSL